MCAALEAGVDRLFRIGGAHAIAALAYGTATSRESTRSSARATPTSRRPRRWSRRLRDRFLRRARARSPCSRATGTPAWIAADLIAQAEHDPDARAILITPAGAWRRPSQRSRAADAGRRPARRALATHGGIVVTRSLDEAIDALPAPGAGTRRLRLRRGRRRLTRAGTVFVGDYSAQAAGDYVTGSNHVLPTERRRGRARRPQRRRLRARLDRAADHARRACGGSRRPASRWPTRRASRATPRRCASDEPASRSSTKS